MVNHSRPSITIKSDDKKYSVPINSTLYPEYFIEIQIGHPPQKFLVQPDTTTPNLWVPSKKCASMNCWVHNRYDSSESASYIPDGKEIQIDFQKSKIEGIRSQDFLQIGEVGTSVTFAEVTKIDSSSYLSSSFDGVFGFGYQDKEKTGIDPPLKVFWDNRLLNSYHVSFRFADGEKDNATMNLGGEKRGLYWFLADMDKLLNDGLWVVNMRAIYEAEYPSSASNGKVYFDTTSPLILGPKDKIKKLTDHIFVEPTCENMDKNPVITIDFDSYLYVLKPEDYIIKTKENGIDKCSLAIAGADNLDHFIFGVPFFKKYRVAFSFNKEKAEIGIN